MPTTPVPADSLRWINDLTEYTVDSIQRTTLFVDTLRQRGNAYRDHLRQGQPPVLAYAHDILMDGRVLDPPTNYCLARIRDRRTATGACPPGTDEKRRSPGDRPNAPASRRPIIIIDPRAGHGPGIGGSKEDSEIGMALDQGYPVYVILFSTWPVPGQTLAQVQKTLAHFVEAVHQRHPEAAKPAVVGNCQAGWAAALLGAARPDIVGPIVMNGAPLSYWAGVKGRNPMRYRGGLTGGAWLASLLGDLGNGIFDGAHLVAGFEDLNPANTLWGKHYHLWANIDTEVDRYLAFERWWNGYTMLTAEELHFIVDQLFVGNRAETGALVMNGRPVDLRRLAGPIVVFASHGDNITPPQQALNWIPTVWGSVDEIRRRKQTIVYMVHGTVGHLGIFVSGAVSRREHREIMASMDLIDYLSPGLYEMVIDDAADPDGPRTVRFEAREMADLRALDDGDDDAAIFGPMAALSRRNDRFYRRWVRPWVKAAVGEAVAEALRQLHPLRTSRYFFSDLNPSLQPVAGMADAVKQTRQPVSPDNPFLAMERIFAETVSRSLDLYRDIRDQTLEWSFYALFDNPWMRRPTKKEDARALMPIPETACRPDWLAEIETGGFAEAVVRMMVALAHADVGTLRRHLATYDTLAERDGRLAGLNGDRLIQAIKKQSCILSSAPRAAIEALPQLLPDPQDRQAAFEMVSALMVDAGDTTPPVSAAHEAIAAALAQPVSNTVPV